MPTETTILLAAGPTRMLLPDCPGLDDVGLLLPDFSLAYVQLYELVCDADDPHPVRRPGGGHLELLCSRATGADGVMDWLLHDVPASGCACTLSPLSGAYANVPIAAVRGVQAFLIGTAVRASAAQVWAGVRFLVGQVDYILADAMRTPAPAVENSQDPAPPAFTVGPRNLRLRPRR